MAKHKKSKRYTEQELKVYNITIQKIKNLENVKYILWRFFIIPCT